MAIDNYKIFNGSEWISPCDCEAQILTPTGWVKLDPRNCPTSYWDGDSWCPIECFEPCKKCPNGYVINPATKTDCIKYSVPEYDGTMRVMSPGSDLQGTYGRDGLALFDELDVTSGNYLESPSPDGNIRTQSGTIVAVKPNILGSSVFKSNVWYYRLCAVGLMEYKYDVWNKKKSYTANTIVLYNDAGVWKKYNCISPVSANITAPFNLNPKLATTKWSYVADVNTIYTTQGSNADINEEYSQFSFTFCLTLSATKVYHIGFSADNQCSVDVQLNETGPFVKLIDQAFSTGWARWFVLPIKLPAGTHILKLKGVNAASVGSIGLEIYDFNKTNSASINSVEKFKELFVYAPGTTTISPTAHTGDTSALLDPNIIFSTRNMRFKEVPKVNDINPATSLPYVPTCPDGSPVSFCNGAPSCITIVDCNAIIEIDENTEINIWFDNSGSMNGTLAPLQTMQSTILKNCLLPIYNNDSVLYDKKVRVLSMTDQPNYKWNFNERFIKCISTERNFQRDPDTNVKLVINLTFADESDAYGYGGSNPFDPNVRSTGFDFDVSLAKTSLSNASNNKYIIKGYAFRVSTGNNLYVGFRGLTEATFVNTGVYTPEFTLSKEYDNSLFKYNLDIIPSSTATYYKDRIIEGLQELGINVPVCP